MTEGETAVLWGPLPVDMTNMLRSIFRRPFSSPAIRIVSVSYYTLCPRPDGPSDHVNEKAIQSDTTAVIPSIYNCKAPFPPPYACRPRSRLCSFTTNPFFLGKIASRSYSCLPPDLLCQVRHSQSISLNCSSPCHFAEPLRDPRDGIWFLDTFSFHV